MLVTYKETAPRTKRLRFPLGETIFVVTKVGSCTNPLNHERGVPYFPFKE